MLLVEAVVGLQWMTGPSTTVFSGAAAITISAGGAAVGGGAAAAGVGVAGAAGGEAAAAGAAMAGGAMAGVLAGAVVAVIAVGTTLIVGFCEGFASPNFKISVGQMAGTVDPAKIDPKYLLLAEQGTDNIVAYYFADKEAVDKAKHHFVASRIIWKLDYGKAVEIENKGFAMPFPTIRAAFLEMLRQAHAEKEAVKHSEAILIFRARAKPFGHQNNASPLFEQLPSCVKKRA